MAHEFIVAAPVSTFTVHTAELQATLPADASLPTPTADQVQASDGVFAQQDEHQVVAGLLGMWTGVLLLHDLAVDTFQVPESEEEPRRKPLPDADPLTP